MKLRPRYAIIALIALASVVAILVLAVVLGLAVRIFAEVAGV